MHKTLCTTTDFLDDLIALGDRANWFTPDNIDQMMAYCASLGSRRHQWILDTMWSFYDADSPAGYDLLANACEAAHRHGMRFDVIFKPFEGGLGGGGRGLPRGFPKPEGIPLLEDRWGIVHVLRPFVAEHSEMRLARAPHDAVDPGGDIVAIRIIARRLDPTEIYAADFSIWTTRLECGESFVKYKGPVVFKETTEYRTLLPYEEGGCRVLEFGGLELPDETDCVKICRHAGTQTVDVSNESEHIVELVNANGQTIPAELAPAPTDPEKLLERTRHMACLGGTRYLRYPEAQEILNDTKRFLKLCETMNAFRTTAANLGAGRMRLGPDSALVVARGKPGHVTGALSPVYPEVRRHWLEHVRFCIDRGVDGVNIRTGNHNKPSDPWAYGYNEPALAAMAHRDNVAELERVNGTAYTQFLRDAADLLHGAGKELGVHVNANMFQSEDRRPGMWWPGKPLPMNIEWQWETWVRDIADYVEFRGAFVLRPENLTRIVDRIGLAAREACIPFIYQSCRSKNIVTFEGPHEHLAWEIERVCRHPDVTAYNLYETAYFTRVNEDGRFEGSPRMAAMIRNHWAPTLIPNY